MLQLILELLDRPADWFDHVNDRPGHDLRYAIDSTKLRTELGWQPKYRDLRRGLEQTIDWYSENRSWWQYAKDAVEACYAETGQ